MVDPVVSSISGVSGSGPVRSGAEVKSGAEVSGGGTDFGSMLSQMAVNTADQLKTAEAVSVSGVKGQASVQHVVEQVMAAEQSLQAAIAIRDKVVSAYMEISRMAI
jgi:flagellar hook-basal body complex protein FliE